MKKILFILCSLLVLVSCTTVFGNFKKEEVKTYYEQVYISNGDTLYDIAKRYKHENMVLNSYIEEIKTMNCIVGNDIYFGTEIIVPVHIYEL